VTEAKVTESIDHALHLLTLRPVRKGVSAFPDDDCYFAVLQYRLSTINDLRFKSFSINFENNSAVC